ncbi:MAG: HEAT repeat domain-containing protein [Vicinamibacterales bacterium]
MRMKTVVAAAALVASSLLVERPALAQEPPTVTFEAMVADLGNDDPDVRLRAVLALKQAAYPESAVPLTRALADGDDRVQFEAIAAELNIWLAEKVVPRKRVGFVVEVRNRISAPVIFAEGAGALSPAAVPLDVLHALRTASHDDNPRVSEEALYAFGALAENAYGPDRATLLTASAAELAAALGVPQANLREAALTVATRLYGWRMGDAAVPETIGDAVVTALNDRSYTIRMAAMDALGAMRYDRGVAALTEVFQHYERGPYAQRALAALARIAHPSSLPLFTAALVGRDAMLRLPGIEGLGRSGASDQQAAIAAALAKERSQDVLLAGHFANVLLSNGTLDSLVDGLTRTRLRPRSLAYLMDLAPGRARLLSPHLPDPQPGVRVDLLTVLGLSGDPDALAIVEPFRQDPDPNVARAAARAVARLSGAAPQR